MKIKEMVLMGEVIIALLNEHIVECHMSDDRGGYISIYKMIDGVLYSVNRKVEKNHPYETSLDTWIESYRILN
jgi:hypothetical protein